MYPACEANRQSRPTDTHFADGKGKPDRVGQDGSTMGIEQPFDVSLIAAMALREKQIQQNYRPPRLFITQT